MLLMVNIGEFLIWCVLEFLIFLCGLGVWWEIGNVRESKIKGEI